MSYNYRKTQCLSGIESVTDGIASLTNGNLYSSNVINDYNITTSSINTGTLYVNGVNVILDVSNSEYYANPSVTDSIPDKH